MVYLLVLLAALAHALWNSMIKVSADKLLTVSTIRAVGLIFGIVAAFYTPLPDFQSFVLIAISTMFHYLYYYSFTNAYKDGDYSVVYPISRGIAPILVLFVSVTFLSADLSVVQLLATVLIVVSIFLMVRSKCRPKLNSIFFAILTGFCISGYTVVGAISFQSGLSFLSYFAWLEIFTGVGVLAIALVLRGSKVIVHLAHNYRSDALAGVLSVFSYGTALWAITLLPVAPVAAIRETSIVFAAIIASWCLNEKVSVRNYTAVVLIFLGVVALAMDS